MEINLKEGGGSWSKEKGSVGGTSRGVPHTQERVKIQFVEFDHWLIEDHIYKILPRRELQVTWGNFALNWKIQHG